MRWGDEHYVKLYTRETADMLLWPWQAHAVWPNLLKRADNAGLLDTGRRDEMGALSALLHLPREVIEVGVEALLEDGCLERVGGGFLVRNFVEAQEARKTEAAKKRAYRERSRDQSRANERVARAEPAPSAEPLEISTPPVPTVSHGVPTMSPPWHPPSSARPLPVPDPVLDLCPTPSSALPDRSIVPARKIPIDFEVFRQLQETRLLRLESLGLDPVPDEDLEHEAPMLIRLALSKICKKLEPHPRLDVFQVHDRYFGLTWPADRKPPFPFRVFASEKVWGKLVTELVAEEAAA